MTELLHAVHVCISCYSGALEQQEQQERHTGKKGKLSRDHFPKNSSLSLVLLGVCVNARADRVRCWSISGRHVGLKGFKGFKGLFFQLYCHKHPGSCK